MPRVIYIFQWSSSAHFWPWLVQHDPNVAPQTEIKWPDVQCPPQPIQWHCHLSNEMWRCQVILHILYTLHIYYYY